MIGRICHLFVALLLCGCDKLFELAVVTSVDASDLPACPDNYLLTVSASPDSRYRYVDAPTQWRVAAVDCASDAPGRTHLAVIDTEAERQEVDDVATVADVWIGMTDVVIEDTYFWVTEQPVPIPEHGIPPWAPQKPDDPTGAQDCVRMNPAHAFLLDDDECETLHHYVCECDDFGDEPAHYTP